MFKFRFNYLENTLAYLKEGAWYKISEENKFSTKYNGQGFNLDFEIPHWITFTVYENKIRVFYKLVEIKEFLGKEEVIYYRKDLEKKEEIIFELTEEDRVIKDEKGHWVNHGNN